MTTTTGPTLSPEIKEQLETIADTLRGLSIDGVQAANSGHPGLPLGCADIAAYLYGHQLRHNPKNPKWLGRDRFILSAGHGSMLLYSSLHVAGFDLSIQDLRNFRQLHSKTPGHPESHETPGVEATTGPLGQGVANAVGQALGLKLLSARFADHNKPLFTSKVYCLAGDGCIMEGVSAEASSLAGHLKLDNLVLIYDANNITLDGPLAESCSEDTMARYRAYGWDVLEIDGHDLDQIHSALSDRERQTRPLLVVAHTVIGKGSPNKAGTHKVHGAPLGDEEVQLTKKALGLPEDAFYVPTEVSQFFASKLKASAQLEAEWEQALEEWKQTNPTEAQQFEQMRCQAIPEDLEWQLDKLEIKSPIAGRAASQIVVNELAKTLPQLVGGSADLSCSDLTMLKELGVVTPTDFTGRNIKYGVREFAMAAAATGLAQTQMITPFVGTFFTFSDYMRNAIRLAALSQEKVIYQFTHDSVFLGEDGPTHQPVEQLASLRAMPNLQVIRPADSNEVKGAWLAALRYDGPTAIVLSRQNLPQLAETKVSFVQGVARGGYVIREVQGQAEFTLIATGSEVALACQVADALNADGKSTRVVSLPCWELFEKQPRAYQDKVLGTGKRVSIEAGSSLGWHKYVGRDGVTVSVDQFGLSAPADDIANELGFTVEKIVARLTH